MRAILFHPPSEVVRRRVLTLNNYEHVHAASNLLRKMHLQLFTSPLKSGMMRNWREVDLEPKMEPSKGVLLSGLAARYMKKQFAAFNKLSVVT